MNRTLVLTSILFALLPGAVLAEEGRTISVNGHGETTTEPDIARVRLGMWIFDKDLVTAKKVADAKMAALLSVLREMEVKPEDISTTELYVQPKYEAIEKEYMFVGYDVTRSITVIVRQLSRLNELLDRCIQAGANRVSRISLQTSRERELKERVLALAIADAKEKATRIAAGFEAKLGKVQEITWGVRRWGTGGRQHQLAVYR